MSIPLRPLRVEEDPASPDKVAKPPLLKYRIKSNFFGVLCAITLALGGWLALTFVERNHHYGGECTSAELRRTTRYTSTWWVVLGGRDFKWPSSTGVRAQDLVGRHVEGRYWKSLGGSDDILSAVVDGKVVLTLEHSLWWIRFGAYAAFVGAVGSLIAGATARPERWD